MPSKQPSLLSILDRTKPQHEWPLRLHISKVRGNPGQGWTEHDGVLVSTLTEKALAENRFVVCRYGDDPAKWALNHYNFLCEYNHDLKAMTALRVATKADCKQWRVPVFIQSEEWPTCCNRSMHFVGQVDDNDICTTPPPEAKYWWHDAASFYIFTCDQCLECKAIGQQF